MFSVLLSAGLPLLAAVCLAASEVKVSGGEALPLNKCFCVRLVPFPFMYYTDRVKSAPPECAALTYDKETQHFWEDGLVGCDDQEKCEKVREPYAEKRKILNAKTAEAKKRLEACCALPKEELRAAVPCSNKCGSDWSAILKVLAVEAEKLDKAETAAQERCLAKSKKTKSEEEKVKPARK